MSGGILQSSVPIRIDGQDLILRYRALAFIRYAEECKSDLFGDLSKVMSQLSTEGQAILAGQVGAGFGAHLATLVNILWAGLVDAQPMLKRDDIARMVDFRNLPETMSGITEAIKLTMPETKQDRPIEARAELLSVRVNGLESGPASEIPAESQPMNSSV